MSIKIEGKVTTVCVAMKYTDGKKRQKIKTVVVFKNGVRIASVYKHPCKEISVYIPDGICLTLDTMQKHIIPIMNDFRKYKIQVK